MIIDVLINCINLKSSNLIEDGDYKINTMGYVTKQSADEILEILSIVMLYEIGNDGRG